MGNARTHEIESLMDEEIETVRHDKLKAYHALVAVGDGLPALGIVAAVLGVVKAMGAIDQSPEILGHLIASALVGTFAGIFFSYAVVGPLATKVKIVRDKRLRSYVIVKQSLLAFMNGAMPQVAIEHGRKAISAYERPTINEVEAATISGGADRAPRRARRRPDDSSRRFAQFPERHDTVARRRWNASSDRDRAVTVEAPAELPTHKSLSNARCRLARTGPTGCRDCR